MIQDNPFLEHILKILDSFGMVNEDKSAPVQLTENMYQVKMIDTVYNTPYIILARSYSSEDPESFWKNILSGLMINVINRHTVQDKTPPVLVVLPVGETDYLFKEALANGVRANIYSLFESHVMLGFSKKDTKILLGKRVSTAKNVVVTENRPLVKPPVRNTMELTNGNLVKRNNRKKKILLWLLFTLVAFTGLTFGFYKLFSGLDKSIAAVTKNAVKGSTGNNAVMTSLAGHAELSDYEMYNLLKNGYAGSIAKNPHIKSDMVISLSSHKDPAVRSGLAQNKAISAELAEKLAHDRVPSVRAAAASNEKLSLNTMKKLAHDKEYQVKAALLDNPKLTNELADIVEPNPRTASCEVKEKLYARRNIPVSVLSHNAINPDHCIRKGIARNINTSSDTLEQLLNDADAGVKLNVAANPNISQSSLDLLNKQYFSSGWQKDTNPANIAMRNALLENPRQKTEILKEAFSNPDTYGSALSKNPSAGGEQLRALYTYAMPKGGLNGFMDEINSMPYNGEIVSQLAEDANWESTLRRKVNSSFAENIYDPVEAAERSGIKVDHKNLSLYDIKDSDGFFYDNKSNIKLNKEDTFEEFFEKSDSSLKQIAVVADDIVDEVMDHLTPVMEKTVNNYKTKKAKGDVTSFILDDLISPVLNEEFYSGNAKKLNSTGG